MIDIRKNGEEVIKVSDEQQKKERKIMEILQVVTCPKCGEKYIASHGHKCSEEAKNRDS